jgi:hypothetical protein
MVGRKFDFVKRLDEEVALLPAEACRNLVLMGLVCCSELSHQSFALSGQIEGVSPLVFGGRATLGETSTLKIIQQRNKIGAPDSESEANVLLLQARIQFDNGQNTVLYRADVESGKGLREIAKHGQLSPSEGISNEVGKMAEIDNFVGQARGAVRTLERSSSFFCHQRIWLNSHTGELQEGRFAGHRLLIRRAETFDNFWW